MVTVVGLFVVNALVVVMTRAELLVVVATVSEGMIELVTGEVVSSVSSAVVELVLVVCPQAGNIRNVASNKQEIPIPNIRLIRPPNSAFSTYRTLMFAISFLISFLFVFLYRLTSNYNLVSRS